MKIQKLQNGEIQITFKIEEIPNFQTQLNLEDIENLKKFEDCLRNVQYKTRDFLKELREHFGVNIDINRSDKKVNDLKYKYQISDVANTLKHYQKIGLVSIKKANEKNNTTSKILTFRFNF